LPAVVAIGLVLGRIGESDCEQLGDGLLAQPVNALTSFAYVLVGLAIAIAAARRVDRPIPSYVYAACIAAIGLGSVAFHGPQPAGSRVMHDLPILIAAVFILCHDLGLLVPRFTRVLTAFAIGVAIATALTLISVEAGAVATGAVLLAVGVAEILVHRRGLRSPEPSVALIWMLVGVALVAGASWILGRTDSPVCDPDGVVQLHGLWHVVSSLIFGLWWWMAIGSGTPTGNEDRPLRQADPAL
jgi:hypothetical protein